MRRTIKNNTSTFLSKASNEAELRSLLSFRITWSLISPEEWAVTAHTVIHSWCLVIQVDPTERLKVNPIHHVRFLITPTGDNTIDLNPR